MSVYVDKLFDTTWADRRKWPYARSCHLTADTPEELHAFAAKLGLRRAWYQERPRFALCHYDLTASKRALAVKFGAIEVDSRPHLARRIRGEGATDDGE